MARLGSSKNNPTVEPLKLVVSDRDSQRKPPVISFENKQGIKKKKNIIIVTNNDALTELFQNYSQNKLRFKSLIALTIASNIPDFALLETIIRKNNNQQYEYLSRSRTGEDYQLIHLNFFETASLFVEDEMQTSTLLSNGFLVEIIQYKTKKGALLEEAEEWFSKFIADL
ncbi:MAG: hypothetical protein WCF93_03735 [Candidatus Moraniibacteriota bacterium]